MSRGNERKPASTKAIVLRSVLALGLALGCVSAVKREDFKTCAQSGFCARNRAYADLAKETPQWTSPFQLNPSSLRLQNGIISGDLLNTQEEQLPASGRALSFELHLLDTEAVRVRINEVDPIKPRYDGVQDTVLIKPYGFSSESKYERLSKDDNGVLTVNYGSEGKNTVKISSAPFKVEFLVNGVSTVILNEEGLLRFERLRNKEAEPEKLVDQGAEGEQEGDIKIEKSALELKLVENLWDERFKDNTDSKPRGNERTGICQCYP